MGGRGRGLVGVGVRKDVVGGGGQGVCIGMERMWYEDGVETRSRRKEKREARGKISESDRRMRVLIMMESGNTWRTREKGGNKKKVLII